MMVSGFGMCCGYYQRIIDQKISVEDFYKETGTSKNLAVFLHCFCALGFVISPSKGILV